MIKVADFGLTEDMYARNYFRRDKSEGGSEEKVPIKWMAPESIEDDIYNEKTDVVSIIDLPFLSSWLLMKTPYGACMLNEAELSLVREYSGHLV